MKTITSVPGRFVSAVRRSFRQFLALPLATVVGFVGLNALVYLADRSWSGGGAPAGFRWLGDLLGDSAALGSLLTTVASSIITVTSITFSLLLLAVQQGAAALTAQVTDQFMARRTNQFYFGYFVGLSVFVLMTLVTNTGFHRPVFGTTIALLLTTSALCLIIVMIYNTIDQMRPAQIIQFIHDRILEARDEDLRLLAATRRMSRQDWPVAASIRSRESGYVVRLDLPRIEEAVRRHAQDDVEIAFDITVGTYRAVNDPLFRVRGRPGTTLDAGARESLVGETLAALTYDDGRDLQHDAAYGLHQLSTIAWTSVSTSKSNPSPGLSVIQALRDIIAHWSEDENQPLEEPTSCIVYADATPTIATDALEAVIVVASESIQSQTLTEAIQTLAILLRHVEQPTADRLADIANRTLSSLGEHVLTRQLEAALEDLAKALNERGFVAVAQAVSEASANLAASLGKLNSRSTRVPGTTS
ncbi:DUF2254 domain-containing protein [Methylobacterium sp. J-072]|uniref:DUF2254 family protein n=1 Tax=Methylobacterium sp. J-072 TaxID=2836651 RepID=UPI001FBBBE16|nr:DUF2254 family protein [Methylobacterium sp. J-072]MCJ2093708.1 DUF2254 domain-containing protein [Methylobacterium sp. J-072]